MTRRPLALALIVAACTTDIAAEMPQGEVTFQGQTYPVVARGETWVVKTDRGPVQCRAATAEDCYWSLRAALLAQTMPDLG